MKFYSKHVTISSMLSKAMSSWCFLNFSDYPRIFFEVYCKSLERSADESTAAEFTWKAIAIVLCHFLHGYNQLRINKKCSNLSQREIWNFRSPANFFSLCLRLTLIFFFLKAYSFFRNYSSSEKLPSTNEKNMPLLTMIKTQHYLPWSNFSRNNKNIFHFFP